MKNVAPIRRRIVVVGVALGLVLALPGTALAQDDARGDATDQVVETDRIDRDEAIRKAKARALEAIDRRLDTLQRLSERVAEHPHVTAEHERQLLADYDAAAAGLRGLAAQIEGAETLAEVLRLSGLIVTDYRIYLVVVPKTYEVVVSDTLVAIAGRFGEVAGKLQEAIERAAGAGFDVTEAQRWLSTANDEIASAQRSAAPVAGQVIGLQASDWPDPAQGALRRGGEMLHDAATDLRDARHALRESFQALREAIGNDRPTDRAATDQAATDRATTDG